MITKAILDEVDAHSKTRTRENAINSNISVTSFTRAAQDTPQFRSTIFEVKKIKTQLNQVFCLSH